MVKCLITVVIVNFIVIYLYSVLCYQRSNTSVNMLVSTWSLADFVGAKGKKAYSFALKLVWIFSLVYVILNKFSSISFKT